MSISTFFLTFTKSFAFSLFLLPVQFGSKVKEKWQILSPLVKLANKLKKSVCSTLINCMPPTNFNALNSRCAAKKKKKGEKTMVKEVNTAIYLKRKLMRNSHKIYFSISLLESEVDALFFFSHGFLKPYWTLLHILIIVYQAHICKKVMVIIFNWYISILWNVCHARLKNKS